VINSDVVVTTCYRAGLLLAVILLSRQYWVLHVVGRACYECREACNADAHWLRTKDCISLRSADANADLW